jgi:hypothetical protein
VLRAGSAGEEVKLLPDGNIGMYNALGAERARFIYSANTPSLRLTQSTGKNTFYYPHGLTSSAEYSINAAGGVGIGTTTPGAALDVATTWNDGATVFTGIKADVTNTASAADSKLLDLQVGGASKFSVAREGSVLFPAGNTVAPSSPGVGNWYGSLALFGGGGGAPGVVVNAAGMHLGHAQILSWGNDVNLSRDSANTLAQRNGVNAQTSNIYNTDDGAGNAEWLSLGFSSDDATIQVAKSGTGVARPLFLRGQTLFLGGAAGSNHWKISTAGHFLTQADNTYDIGAASANRPRNGYFSGTIAATGTVKTTPTTVGALPAAATAGAGARTFVTDSANSLSSHHGQIVAGGGANFSPVYSDGTNWLVG